MKNPIVSNWSYKLEGYRRLASSPFNAEHKVRVDDLTKSHIGREYRFTFNLNSGRIITHQEIASKDDIHDELIKSTNLAMSDYVYGDMRKRLIGIMMELNYLEPSKELDNVRNAVDSLIRYCDGEEVDL
jgi:hypothetical protein